MVPAIVAQESSRPIVDGDQHIEVAVVVVVAVRGPTGDHRALEGGARRRRHFLESPLPEIVEQMWALGVGDARLEAFDVVGDVPVCGKDVRAPVEIVIEEEAAEGQRQQRRRSDRRPRRLVDEQPVPFVVVQRHHLIREIADDKARMPRSVVIGRVHSHPSPRDARLAERHAGAQGDVHERAVALVAVQIVRLRVVGHE